MPGGSSPPGDILLDHVAGTGELIENRAERETA